MRIEDGGYYQSNKGEKHGPMVWEPRGWFYVENKLGCWLRDGTYQDHHTREHLGDLIAKWTDGPVRTVTRREVVAGSYGRVSVRSASPEQGFATIGLTNQNGYCQDHQYVSAAELKAAAAVLLELAGALE